MSWFMELLDTHKAKSLIKKDEWGRELDFLLERHSKKSKKLVVDHLDGWLPILEFSLKSEPDNEEARKRIELIRKAVNLYKGLLFNDDNQSL